MQAKQSDQCYFPATQMGEPAENIGPYRIVRRLGVGGMAETFEAIRIDDNGIAQRVCIKCILASYEEDKDLLRLFDQEARMIATLRHGNIVGVVDVGTLDGAPYMVLELVDGIDLRALLSTAPHKRLDAEIVRYIGIELAEALAHAHDPDLPIRSYGIVHRDISPSNVLIARGGEIRLTDFGLAKAIESHPVTQSGAVRGKIPYMSPEHMRGAAIDGRADLFSLGVMLFECLAGQRPFDGSHEVETMTRILAGHRLDLATLNPDVDPQFINIINRLITHNRDERFKNAAEVVDELSALGPYVAQRRKLAVLIESRLGGPITRAHVSPHLYFGAEVGTGTRRKTHASKIISSSMARASNIPTAPQLQESKSQPNSQPKSASQPNSQPKSASQPNSHLRQTIAQSEEPLTLENANHPAEEPTEIDRSIDLSQEANHSFNPLTQEPPIHESPQKYIREQPAKLRLDIPDKTPQTNKEPLFSSLNNRKPIQYIIGGVTLFALVSALFFFVNSSQNTQSNALLSSSPRSPVNSVNQINQNGQSTELTNSQTPSTSMSAASVKPIATQMAEPHRENLNGQATNSQTAPPPPTTTEPAADTGSVRVSVIPWGNVWVDHQSKGRAPRSVTLRPGPHLIEAGLEGPTHRRRITVVAGERRNVLIDLTPGLD